MPQDANASPAPPALPATIADVALSVSGISKTYGQGRAAHTAISGAATLNARLPGQWFQLEAGLHYNWHRHYDASIGRYTQPDPLGFVDGASVYGYAGGAPFLYVNPYGLHQLN